jgi:hypothetical protein
MMLLVVPDLVVMSVVHDVVDRGFGVRLRVGARTGALGESGGGEQGEGGG